MTGTSEKEERAKRWLALARVPGVVAWNPVREFRDGVGARIARAFDAPEEEGDWCKALWDAKRRLGDAEREIVGAMRRCAARAVDVDDDEYPAFLSEIPDPPPVLFVRGRILPCDARALAVVGSRHATRYGIAVTRKLVPPLIPYGITVVSGMAIGVDSAAHRAALEGGGRTIAVLGTGIDVPYPQQSNDLYEAAPEHGAVVSEALVGLRAAPGIFPPRNRIIAGLAKMTVVMEAREHSGTSITAGFARDFGRELGAVPGDIDVGRSDGTNKMLSEGAHPIRSSLDILGAGFGVFFADPDVRNLPVEPTGRPSPSKRVLQKLSKEPVPFDRLVAATGMSAGPLLATLSGLARAGLARRDEQGRYALP